MNACKCKRNSIPSRFKIIPIVCATDSGVALPESKKKEGTISTQNDDKVIKRMRETTLVESVKIFDPLEDIPEEFSTMQQEISQSFVDPQEATYMDVAVIRCLLIKHWAENGVYWAIKYLLHRLYEIKMYRNSQTIMHRSRANSMPTISHLKLFKTDNRQILRKIQYHPPVWDDLQLEHVEKKLKKCKKIKRIWKDSLIKSDKKYGFFFLIR
ncbi:unnamed protein product [Onchocerca flexuosa]|uniref:39S ribosomal protein L22, mitochondrial n=1 Tax=Onchocerca flexuosa TaxID=387005 RepID=A0A183HN64_9BILA|nr:unnamed protein product [Onchocerca flexuosa]